jgi:DNA-binding beta-propeller fold protein YncE
MVMMINACFQQVVETRPPLPDIIWPKPPDIPRVRLVNSISTPEDLNIRETGMGRFIRFLKGKENKSIVKPYGVAKDNNGKLYVVDNFHRQVHVFDESNGVYYIFPERGTSFTSPIGIAVDNRGTVYVSDSKDSVVRIFKEGGKKYIKEIGKDFLQRPTGLAINDKTGELLVVDTKSSKIIRYDIMNNYTVKGIIGDEGNKRGHFHFPTNIYVSRKGSIVVSDSLNFRIQVFSDDGEFSHAFGQAGNSPGYFSRPRGVATDSDENIYVVDALFDNVQIFDKEGRLLMDFGGPGNNYGEFWLPSGIYIDSDDQIYVSDSYNHRVQVFKYMKEDEFINE